MDQHLIALDLDGTTLNNQSKLTNETIITLRALARDGHIVSIITGRPYRIAKHIYDEIGIKTPMGLSSWATICQLSCSKNLQPPTLR